MDPASIVWASEKGSGEPVHLLLDVSSKRMLLSKDVRDENDPDCLVPMSSCYGLIRYADHGCTTNSDRAPRDLS